MVSEFDLSQLFIKTLLKTKVKLIVIYSRDNFVYNHWGCTLIYWPFSYPLRSLKYKVFFNVMLIYIPLIPGKLVECEYCKINEWFS